MGAVLFLPGPGTAPAYSVQEGNTGVVTVEIRAPRDADGLRRALADHGIPAVITYLPELRACAPGRYAEVERATSGMSVSVGADALEVTIPPGTVRDGETFVLVRSVLPLSGTDVPVEGFYRERRRDSRARPWPRACRRPWEVDAEGAGRRRGAVGGWVVGLELRNGRSPAPVGWVPPVPGGVGVGGVLLSHALPSAVPSALVGLASGFGMGPGVSPPL